MAFLAKGRILVAAVVAVLALATGAQAAGSCGKTGAGFDAWKQDFAAQAVLMQAGLDRDAEVYGQGAHQFLGVKIVLQGGARFPGTLYWIE